MSAPTGGPLPSLRVGRPSTEARPARRLVLSAAEWTVLADGRLPDAPPGFGPAEIERVDAGAAVAALVERGVITPDAEPVPAVAAQLVVLRRPAVTVRLDVDGRGGARRTWIAVGSGVVVSVLTAVDGGVELSVAPAVRLGEELARAVPDAASVTGAGEESAGSRPPAGRVPWVVLADEPDAHRAADADDLALVQDLERRTAGSLTCLVLGRTGEQVGAGQVSWLATDAGWVGLRPRPDGSPQRMVDLVPVEPADLGTWLAPTLAALLEGSDEQS
ncbi:ESX secretion-associated protein EspG [Candidatus Blastococcus massiliensis]|uniref:ESX secretion-associated protein EspG n=1 Tax=Candidatus Blastococcus massiliensis TaxID=1470358 RepID=UPI00141358AC|nr:ESX secretion-associated protein EspG [Candidatus Blastococcus massiliensis]